VPGPTRQLVGRDTVIEIASIVFVGRAGVSVVSTVKIGSGVSMSVTGREVGRINVGVKVKVGKEVGVKVSVKTGMLVSVLTIGCSGKVIPGMTHAKLVMIKNIKKYL